MKLLFLLNQGMGNCIEMIPTYLNLKDAGHEIDVCYLKEYPTDSAKAVAVFPCNVIEEITYSDIVNMTKDYDHVIKPPQLLTSDGSFIPEFILGMRERDSEVQRNLNICRHLKITADIKKQIIMEETPIPEGDYIVLHNGAQKGWEVKRYPHMLQLAYTLKKVTGKRIVSIGGKNEYIWGTDDYTGLPIRKTAYMINNACFYVGTDTGTYHLAAALDKKGVAIFTKTSIKKNWDGRFHSTIKPIQRQDLLCCPCQWSYHWSLVGENCKKHICRDIPVETIVKEVVNELR
jgi:ADP-heptose:LPS heptosyltransferase